MIAFLKKQYLKFVVAMMLVFSLAASAFAQSETISISTGEFIAAINQWLPMAMTIAAIGVGIAGGFKLARFVGRMIVDAFDGRL